MEIGAVLWDLDDTLVDTNEWFTRERRAVLSSFGLASHAVDDAIRIWDRLYWYFDTSDDAAILSAAFSEMRRDQPTGQVLEDVAHRLSFGSGDSMSAMLGVVDCLQDILARGVALGVVSNGLPARQVAKLESAGLSGFFKPHAIVIVPAGDGQAKPRPYSILKCIGALEAQPDACIYIGDRRADVVAANLAGVASVYIPSGSADFKEPVEVKLDLERPTHRFSSISEFHAWIRNMLST